jgi:DNA-binding beta-propeller fold protein YncE
MTHFTPLSRQTLRGSFTVLLLSFLAAPAVRAQVNFTTSGVKPLAGSYNSLAIDNTNTKHVATYDATSRQLLYSTEPPLMGWQAFENVDASGDNVGEYCSMALDDSGNPYIAYYDATTQSLKLAHRSLGTWTVEVVGLEDAGPNSLALDSNGDPHIIYTQAGIMYAHKTGGVWTTLAVGPGFGDAIAVDQFNRVHMIFHNVNPTTIRIGYGVKPPLSGFTLGDVEAVPFSSGFTGAASLDVDVSSNPHVSYVAACALHYAHLSPQGAWTIETVDNSSGLVSATSIKIDKDGSPRVAYQADPNGNVCTNGLPTTGNLFFAYKQLGYWIREVADPAPSAGIVPSLALDAFFNPAIAYGVSSSLYIAEGKLVNIWYTTPNAVTPGLVKIRAFGSGMDSGGPIVAQLQGPSTFVSTSQQVILDSQYVDLDFDLNGAPSGFYTLILGNASGADTLSTAVLVHNETVTLNRVTTKGSDDYTPDAPKPGHNVIAFVSDREGQQDLFVQNPLANDITAFRLTNSGTAGSPSWNAGGSQLVFHDVTTDRLYVADGNTGGILAPPPQVGTGGPARNPSWSPVSDEIAYDDGSQILGVHYPSNVLETHFGGTDPDWSPDGQALVYVLPDADGGTAIETTQISSGIQTEIVPANHFFNQEPAWSPDGQWVAFSSNRGGGEDSDIWIAKASGGALIPITTSPGQNESQPAWSQDGQSLYFTSNGLGNVDVVQASNLPINDADGDGDGIPDQADACPLVAPLLGQIDQDHDGCPDLGSSFRFTRYWSLDRFPITIEKSTTGDPSIPDDSEFTEYNQAIGTWQTPGPTIQFNYVNGGLNNAVSGDGRNSVTFTDPDGFILGTVAITYSTVADDDTTIAGRLYYKNEVIDSDVLFNTQNYAFSTPTHAGPAGAFSLRNVATHELGHFFGFGHSTLQKSTMFYVAYRDTAQTSLAADDIVLAKNGYHGAAPAPTLSIEGKVLHGEDGITPVPGAAVFAIKALNDTVQMTVSGVDGTYRFFDLASSVRIFIAPLDGSGTVNGLAPSGISSDLATVAETDFLPEYYDGGAESNSDFGTPGVLVTTYPLMNANIITNPDLTGPVVVSKSPADGATNVPATTTIVVGFDERIDITSVSGNLHLENQTTHTGVGGAAAFLTPSNLLVFTPSAPLDFSTVYVMTVETGITDLNGNPLADNVTFQFTTQAQPPLVVTGAAPAEVPIGGTLVLSGSGFSPIAGNNLVSFTGGTTATPYAATLDQIFVSVPPGTQTGNLHVTVGAQSSNDFSIVIVPPQQPPVGVFLGNGTLAGNPRKVTLVPSGAYAYVATSAGVTAMNALPSSANFLQTTQINVAGGTAGIAAHPDGQRVLAIASNPPALLVIDASPVSAFFNTVLQTVPLPAEPLGIAMNPGGASALIVYADRVAAYNMASGALFGLEIREWTQTGVSFLGDVSVSPDAAQAYAATSGGKVAVLGMATGEGVVGLLAAGTTPRETAGTPLANAFFAVDESGTLSRFAARGPLQGSITVGGSYGGLALSPDGSFAYALNFTLNRVDVMDAFAQTPTVVTSFNTGVDPVDIAVGSGGRYFYVAGDGGNVLQVYDGQSGVVVKSIFPRSGGDQTLITVAGSGFSATPSQNVVRIGNTQLSVVSTSPTALTVLQNGVVSGPLRVSTGSQVSNPINYKGVNLDQTPLIGLGALNDTNIPEMARLIETPDGRWLIGIRNDGSMTVIQADPTQPNFLSPVQNLSSAETQLNSEGPMAVTPDGRKLYVADSEAASTAVFTLNGPSNNPLARVSTVSKGGLALAGEYLAVTPDGARLLILSDLQDVVYEVATRNDSVMNVGPGDAIGGALNNPTGLAIDPRGNRVYVGSSINATVSVVVFDILRSSATYRQQLTSWSLPSGSGPYQLTTSPRGDFLYAATLFTLATSVQNDLSCVDINPLSVTYGHVLITQPVGLNGSIDAVPNHSGSTVFVLNNNAPGFVAAFSNDGTLTDSGLFTSSARLSGKFPLVSSLDDARLYVPALGGGVYVTDVSGVSSVHVISGDGQVAVANQPLSLPLVVDAHRFGGEPAEGAVFVYDGLHGDFGAGKQIEVVTANAQGFAEAASYIPVAAGSDRVDALSGAGTLQFFMNVVGDTTAAAPQLMLVTPGPNDLPGNLTNVAVDFSKAIVPGTVSTSSLAVQPQGGLPLAGTYTFANQGRRIVFDPTLPLNFNATYQVVVTAALQDYDGHPLANPGTSTFTTGAAPSLTLDAVNATAALPGNVIVLSGSGFDAVAAQNTVVFAGGAAVTPSRADPGALSVVVPSNAVSGPVHVVVGPNSSNTLPFVVLGQTTPLNQPLNVVSVPSSGQAIAVLPNGVRAYMTSPSANAVVPILIANGTAENPIAVGQSPFGVAPAPNSSLVYVSNFLSNTVSVIGTDPAAAGFHTVVHTIPTGLNPSGLVVNPDGRTLYVCNYGSETVSFIDIDPTSATYNTAKADINVGSSSKTVGVSPDGTTLIVGNSISILLLNALDGSAKADINVGSSSKSVGVSPDGAFAVVLLDNGHLMLIDIRPGIPTDERAKADINVGSSSKSVGVSPDGGSVYITKADGTVDVYAIVALGGAAAVAEPITSTYEFRFVISIQVGENPEGLAFDKTTGLLLVVNSGDNTVSFFNASGISAGPATALCDIDPNSINPSSKGKYINAFLQFPTFLHPQDVVLSTVRLNAQNGSVPAETTASFLDHNGDGITEIQVRFDRTAVQNLLPVGFPVPVSVTGTIDGRTFAGYDSIKVLRPKIKNPHADQIVPQLSSLNIQWSPIGHGMSYKMDIYYSRDGGTTWSTVVMATDDDSSYVWTVPDVVSSRDCLLQLVAKNKKNEVTGVEIMEDPFTISDAPLGVDETLPARFALLPSAPNPFTALGTKVRFDLPEPSSVTLRVFGVDGGVVRTLADNAMYPAGRHAVAWDGRNEQGIPIHGGVYFIKIQAGSKQAVQKVVRVTR